jgi:hypothetical protein
VEIDLLDLKRVIDVLFEHLVKQRAVTMVELDQNFFWEVPEEAAYLLDAPPQLDVGSLDDNWEFLSKLLVEGSSPVAYQLTELAPLLRAIGEKLARELAHQGG